jgi:hypothetical protein
LCYYVVANKRHGTEEAVLSVIDNALAEILQEKSLLQYNDDFIATYRYSLPHILSGMLTAAAHLA